MSEQLNNQEEKQTPFLKRISNIEKDLDKLNKSMLEIKKQVETLRKSIKR